MKSAAITAPRSLCPKNLFKIRATTRERSDNKCNWCAINISVSLIILPKKALVGVHIPIVHVNIPAVFATIRIAVVRRNPFGRPLISVIDFRRRGAVVFLLRARNENRRLAQYLHWRRFIKLSAKFVRKGLKSIRHRLPVSGIGVGIHNLYQQCLNKNLSPKAISRGHYSRSAWQANTSK